jgi:hypothetical protein
MARSFDRAGAQLVGVVQRYAKMPATYREAVSQIRTHYPGELVLADDLRR